jgi:signal transduction histidine kinase
MGRGKWFDLNFLRSSRFLMLYKNTAVRLSAVYLLLFSVCAALLVFYVTSISESELQSRMKDSVSDEVTELDEVYSQGGIAALLKLLERRSHQPGANLYVIAGPNGEILAGNVAALQPGVLDEEGWTPHPFLYKRYGERSGNEQHAAVAHVFLFPNGLRILVGRDIGEPENARLLVRQALMLALGIMGVGALIIWFAIGRNALRRIDRTSEAAQKIMDGDLSERLPVTGSGDEFDRLALSLNAMLSRMERLNEGLRQVSDNIAHDLKTPLTRLRNKAENALTGEREQQEYRGALEDVIAESDQLIRTFNALLMISRVEAGSAAAEMSDLDLSAIAAEFAELYEPVAEDQELELKRSIEPGNIIRGNRELVGQAISNLLDNAIKYGENRDNPLIEISVMKVDDAIRLRVADHGVGVPEDKYGDVVKRFYRLDESRSKPGTGLGLALAVAVMELHGGHIELSATDPEKTEHRGLAVDMLFPQEKHS